MHIRKHRILFVFPIMLLCACSSSSPKSQSSPSPLFRTAKIPWSEIEALYNPRERQTLQGLKYSGYVIMEGEIADDGKVQIRKISESYPDHSRDRLAQVFGRTAVIHSPTLGSRINPKAGVFVIFYDDTFEGNVALIFAKNLEFPGKGTFAEGVYLNGIRY
jgi:hypothetical protein